MTNITRGGVSPEGFDLSYTNYEEGNLRCKCHICGVSDKSVPGAQNGFLNKTRKMQMFIDNMKALQDIVIEIMLGRKIVYNALSC